jgi:NAD(P)-dependent dehydrogenase (short-subunit alcohol dehydrogenase family)
MQLEDKVAVITGGANGIGRAVALRYAREGARVVVADIESENAQKAAEEIRAVGGKALAVAVDVRARESVDELFARAVAEFGRVDILAAIAGISPPDKFVDLPDEHWDDTLAVNLKGVFLCGQVAARRMIVQGTGGRIVNMSSTNGLVGEEEYAHYNASKFGVVGLSMTMAIELAPYKITVNAVCPGFIRTRMSEELIAQPVFARDYLKKIPLGRFGEPDDVAGAFVFLASGDSGYVTGTTLVVDGGQLAL